MALTKVTGELIDIGDLDLSDVGTISLDAIQGDADANTSITFSGSDVITIATGGSGRLTIGDGALSPVTNNQIDLGTASLEFKNAFFDGTVTADAFAGPLTGNVTGNASGTALTVTQAAQTAITSVGTLTGLTVTSNATINGLTKLDNWGSASGHGRIEFGNSGEPYIQGIDTGNGGSGAYLKFGINTTDVIYIKSDYKVGIGTTSPSAKLELSESADGAKLRLNRAGVAGWDFSIGSSSTLTGVGSGALELLPQNANTANEFAIGTAGSTAALFHLTNSYNKFAKKVAIGVVPETDWHADWHGFQVGEGTLGVLTTGAQLSLAQNARPTTGSSNSGWKYIKGLGATQYVQDAGNHYWKYAASGSVDGAITWTQAMTITNGGNILISNTKKLGLDGTVNQYIVGTAANDKIEIFTNTSSVRALFNASGISGVINDTSDRALKENIVNLGTSTTTLKALTPRTFDWKAETDANDQTGFIAQEIEAVNSNLVSGEEGHKAINTIGILAIAVKTIQELEARITTLEG
tara:strand:- start:1856 stop:3427 length:1572 start_codon:yes stop_codon:yes gene_type:complete